MTEERPKTYKCWRCGAEIEEGQEFCLGCGRLTILDEEHGFEDYDAYADEMDEELEEDET